MDEENSRGGARDKDLSARRASPARPLRAGSRRRLGAPRDSRGDCPYASLGYLQSVVTSVTIWLAPLKFSGSS